jgi:hypothetical protein
LYNELIAYLALFGDLMTVQNIRWKKHLWLIALLAIVLTQLACDGFDKLFFADNVIEYCDEGSWGFRFSSYRSCLESLSATCPDTSIPGMRDQTCQQNWLNNSVPPTDCTPFTISAPATMAQSATTITISWTPPSRVDFYRIAAFVGGRGRYITGADLNRGRTSETFAFAAGTTDIRFTVSVMLGDDYLGCRIERTVQRVAPLDCSVFRLTAPLDGLPNGVTTFYWDALPSATSYGISVADAANPSAPLSSMSIPSGSTNTTLDLSTAAIGGSTSMVVTLQAFNGATAVCTDSRTLTRAWNVLPAPVLDVTSTPSSTPDPNLICGDEICSAEIGESTLTCERDCPAQ